MFCINICMNNLPLKYPPLSSVIKKTAIPEKLIYHIKTRYDYFIVPIDKFIMFSTKKGSRKTARMICFPQMIKRDEKQVPSLYIWKLFAPGDGFGTAMLDFAKTYSRQIGCGGNFHLQASGCYMPQRVPHIFYRKYGMNTVDPYINKKLDLFISKGKKATYKDFDEICMYYPPLDEKRKSGGLFSKILRIFKSDI